jgi:hypothetical protein
LVTPSAAAFDGHTVKGVTARFGSYRKIADLVEFKGSLIPKVFREWLAKTYKGRYDVLETLLFPYPGRDFRRRILNFLASYTRKDSKGVSAADAVKKLKAGALFNFKRLINLLSVYDDPDYDDKVDWAAVVAGCVLGSSTCHICQGLCDGKKDAGMWITHEIGQEGKTAYGFRNIPKGKNVKIVFGQSHDELALDGKSGLDLACGVAGKDYVMYQHARDGGHVHVRFVKQSAIVNVKRVCHPKKLACKMPLYIALLAHDALACVNDMILAKHYGRPASFDYALVANNELWSDIFKIKDKKMVMTLGYLHFMASRSTLYDCGFEERLNYDQIFETVSACVLDRINQPGFVEHLSELEHGFAGVEHARRRAFEFVRSYRALASGGKPSALFYELKQIMSKAYGVGVMDYLVNAIPSGDWEVMVKAGNAGELLKYRKSSVRDFIQRSKKSPSKPPTKAVRKKRMTRRSTSHKREKPRTRVWRGKKEKKDRRGRSRSRSKPRRSLSRSSRTSAPMSPVPDSILIEEEKEGELAEDFSMY